MMKKQVWGLLFAGLTVPSVNASVIDTWNWVDDVVEYSSNIQNYSGELLNNSLEWFLTGMCDSDVDGNGYVWDSGDRDTVAGWRSNAPGEYIVVSWDLGIPDVPGNDLALHYFGGMGASASVFASEDGQSFQYLGLVSSGQPGFLTEASLDFDGLFSSEVHYLKVVRESNGPQTGMFFDAFAGVVPEPTTFLLILSAGLVFVVRPR